MQCNKCGRPSNTPGVTMNRINPKGEKGIFECSPACNVTHISNEVALEHALEFTNMKQKHIKAYDTQGLSHILLTKAKEVFENRDQGVFKEVDSFKYNLQGEWHCDALEALIAIECDKLDVYHGRGGFIIVPVPSERILDSLEEGDGSAYVLEGKGGRVFIKYDDYRVFTICDLVGIHKLIIDSIGDGAIGISGE